MTPGGPRKKGSWYPPGFLWTHPRRHPESLGIELWLLGLEGISMIVSALPCGRYSAPCEGKSFPKYPTEFFWTYPRGPPKPLGTGAGTSRLATFCSLVCSLVNPQGTFLVRELRIRYEASRVHARATERKGSREDYSTSEGVPG